MRVPREEDPTAPLLQGQQHGYQAIDPANSPEEGVPTGTSSPERLPEKWNQPKIKAWRVLATFYSFIVVGANDGAYGVSSSSLSVVNAG